MQRERGHRLLVPHRGPVTVVPSWSVGREVRRRACPVAEAREVVRQLVDHGRTHDLMAMEAMGGPRLHRGGGADLGGRLVWAVDRGVLLLFRGWGPPGAIYGARHRPTDEEKLFSRIVDRERDCLLEGARYRLLPSAAWPSFPGRREYQVVPRQRAREVVLRIALYAPLEVGDLYNRIAEMMADDGPGLRGFCLLRRLPPRATAPILDEPLPPPPARRPVAHQKNVFEVTHLWAPAQLAPGAETIDIQYAFSDPGGIGESAELQLFSGDSEQPIWTRPIPADHLAALEGSVPWDGAIDRTDAMFPDGFVTLEGSPYRLKLTGRGGGEESERERTIEVVLAELTVSPAPAEHLVHERDREVHAQIGSLPGRFPLQLEGNAFTQNDSGTSELYGHDVGYQQYRALWEGGAGPRIPLIATVLIRNSAGRPTAAGKAVGRGRILWDYVEQHATPLSVWSEQNSTLLHKVGQRYQHTARPLGGTNAAADFGGKRDRNGATPVLAAPDRGLTNFPFKVSAGSRRFWSALSPIEREGTNEAKAGVVFRPAITAGDGYSITAYLDLREALDVDDAKLPEAVPQCRVGDFQVWRKVTLARRVFKCPEVVDRALDPSPWFHPAFVALDNRFAENFGILTKVEYDRLFEAARLRVKGEHGLIGEHSLPEGVSQYDAPRRDLGRFLGVVLRLFRGGDPPTPWVASFRTFDEFLDAVAQAKKWPLYRALRAAQDTKVEGSDRYLAATAKFALSIAARMAAMLAKERGVTALQFEGTQASGRQWGGVAGFKELDPASRDKTGYVAFQNSASVMAHEIGHCLFLPHAPTPHDDHQPEGVVPARHVTGSLHCMMSYAAQAPGFCAVCLLRLAGYDGDRIPLSDTDPIVDPGPMRSKPAPILP